MKPIPIVVICQNLFYWHIALPFFEDENIRRRFERAHLSIAKLVCRVCHAPGIVLSRTPRSALDTIIAAVAAASDCVVVTDSEKDFFDIEIVNPVRDHGRE